MKSESKETACIFFPNQFIKCKETSLSSSISLIAPMRLSEGAASLNIIYVGIDDTLYLIAISLHSSTLIFANTIELCRFAMRSNSGSIRAHGMHQGAQKSTNRFLVDFRMRSKFDDVSFTMRDIMLTQSLQRRCFYVLKVKNKFQDHPFRQFIDLHFMISRSFDCSLLLMFGFIESFALYFRDEFVNAIFFRNFALEF